MKTARGKKTTSTPPCAACKLLRRRCAYDCIFAPYFPAEEPQKFANVHKVFGASNVSKMLQELPEQHRSGAVSSMVFEANARLRDPVYGCVSAISTLQHQVELLQAQLAVAHAEMLRLRLWQRIFLAAAGDTTGSSSGDCPTSTAASKPLSNDMVVDQSFALLETQWAHESLEMSNYVS
ncbi:LOB domain-containing protein 4-like [Wolffia australiana]